MILNIEITVAIIIKRNRGDDSKKETLIFEKNDDVLLIFKERTPVRKRIDRIAIHIGRMKYRLFR